MHTAPCECCRLDQCTNATREAGIRERERFERAGQAFNNYITLRNPVGAYSRELSRDAHTGQGAYVVEEKQKGTQCVASPMRIAMAEGAMSGD